MNRFEIVGLKNYSGSVQHIKWLNQTDIIIVADIADSGLNLILFQLNELADQSYELIEQKRTILEFPVLNISYNKTGQRLAIQSTTGSVIKYDKEFSFVDEFQFPQACPTFQFITIKDMKQVDQEVCIGTTQYYRLYADRVEIANNCNSFYVHDEFLLFTDHTNTLKFVDLAKISN